MFRIVVEWSSSHHPADDRSMIASHLAAGLDEGPLLAISCGSGRRSNARRNALIFKDVNDYLAHLAMYEGELADERWVGLVRGASAAYNPISLAALFQVKEWIAPTIAPEVTGRPSGRERKRQFDYAVLTGPFITAEPFEIVSTGDGAHEVAAAFPAAADLLGFDCDE